MRERSQSAIFALDFAEKEGKPIMIQWVGPMSLLAATRRIQSVGHAPTTIIPLSIRHQVFRRHKVSRRHQAREMLSLGPASTPLGLSDSL
jgi:hypothetical protein